MSDYYVGTTFTSTGRHSVALQTIWNGTFTVRGFGTFTVPDPVITTSPTAEFQVREARGELIG